MSNHRYVKLISKPNTWFLSGTEVWSEDYDRRLTEEEFDDWKESGIIAVKGIRELDPNFSYERKIIEETSSRFRIDVEVCGIDEFEMEISTGDDGSGIIEKLKSIINENNNRTH